MITAGRVWGGVSTQHSGRQGLRGHVRDSGPVVMFLAQGISGEFEGEAESRVPSVLMLCVALWLVVSAVVASQGCPLNRGWGECPDFPGLCPRLLFRSLHECDPETPIETASDFNRN